MESVSIITDRDTGRSKGFGFVAMSDDSAEKAISQLNGTQLNGRALTVNEARPMVKKDFRGRQNSGRGGYGLECAPRTGECPSQVEYRPISGFHV